MVTRRFVAQEDLHNRLLNEFASLAAAVTAIGATEVTLLMNSASVVAANLTVPANITLVRRCYQKTYIRPKELCSVCRKVKSVKKRIDSNPLCGACYVNLRYNTDELFRLKRNLRGELLHAFKAYSFGGKKRHAKQYGIDYKKILDHLGPCPGERGRYHIDHIFPLSAFNFDDPIQVRAAFAPENHQWLPAYDNLSKNDKYDESAFVNYLGRFLMEGELHG